MFAVGDSAGFAGNDYFGTFRQRHAFWKDDDTIVNSAFIVIPSFSAVDFLLRNRNSACFVEYADLVCFALDRFLVWNAPELLHTTAAWYPCGTLRIS